MPALLRAPVSLLAGAAKHPLLMAVAGPMGLQPTQLIPGRIAVQNGKKRLDVVIALELEDSAAQVAQRQLSQAFARGRVQVVIQAQEGPMDLLLIGPAELRGASRRSPRVPVDLSQVKARAAGSQNRLAHVAGAGAQPRCSWRYVAASGAIQGGCALDNEPFGNRYPLTMAPALTEDDRPADSACRQRMTPLLSELMKAAPDQLAQRMAATTEGLTACLAASTQLSEAGKAHWRTLVGAFVKEAKDREASALEQPEAMRP